MAGIGFELKKLFKATGVVAKVRAYGYTGAVTAGPMILGFLFLLSVNLIASFGKIIPMQRELLTNMITYALLSSMLFSSFFSMVLTRYVADLFYDEREEDVIPSLEGILRLLLPIGGILWAVFLCFAGIGLTNSVLLFCLFIELVGVWNVMNYLTAVKDYKGILINYVISIVTALLLAVGGTFIFGGHIELLLGAVVIGYGMMFALDLAMLYRFFPNSGKRHFDFLPWFDKYQELIWIGFFINVGLFSHLMIAWISPVGYRIQGLFFGAPKYDIPALFAFMTILITTINFVISVEVNLYPKYRRYYDLFNGKGSIVEIEQAENAMITVLDRELSFTARRQLYFTTVMITVGIVILSRLPLGLDSLMEGYFRVLCAGYGAYAIGNVVMLILMYFTDYRDALKASAIFAGITTLGSIISINFDMKYYGFAFATGAIVYMVFCSYKLTKYVKNIPYYVLSTQPLMAEQKRGVFTRLLEYILKKQKEI
jgi:uncharacterized membrane protein